MSKPEDIPQDIWETAQSINQVLPYSHVQGRIARAILEEREACAAIALDIAEKNAGYSDGPGAMRVYNSIRKRSDVNTAHNKKSQEV